MSQVLLRRWTRDEYERMVEVGVFPPGDRLELIDGEIVTMTPQGSGHATAVGLAEDVLRVVFQVGYHIRGQRPLALEPSSEPEPDIAVVPGSLRDYRDAHPTTAILVVEVADTTLAYDRDHKGSLYACAGIPEYWIVNLPDQVVEVYRDPAPAPKARFGWGYRTVRPYRSGETLAASAAPQKQIAVVDLLP
jgi:Uma2 family endonuclease